MVRLVALAAFVCACFTGPAMQAVAQTPQTTKAAANRLMDAVRSGNKAEVDRLLAQGVDPNTPDGWPLILAVERGAQGLPIIRTLLDHGADPNARGSDHDIALVAAIDAYVGEDEAPGIVEVLRLLIERGARQDVGVRSPLSAALLRPGRSLAARFLIEHGASLEAGDGYTPLHAAAYAGLPERVRDLLKAGADPNARDRSRRTPLLLAADGGSEDILAALLDTGADINARTPQGDSALLVALTHKRIAAARMLVRRGADVNVVDEKGEPPLIAALRLSQWPSSGEKSEIDSLIGDLLDRGADVNAVSRSRETPLIMAVTHERGWEPGRKGWVKALLGKGADPNKRTDYYGPALVSAVVSRRKSLEVPEWLIAHGADVNRVGAGGMPPLMSAVTAADYPLAMLLIEKGARVDCVDDARKTPLHWAAFHGELKAVEALLKRRAAVNAEDIMGQTPLALAIKANRPEVRDLLLSRGGKAVEARPPARNASGQIVIRLPVGMIGGGIAPTTFALSGPGDAPKLRVLRGKTRVCQPVDLASLFTNRDLWTPRELNDNLSNLQRGYYSAGAYRSFGLVSLNGKTYLGLLWYSPAASDQHQVIQFVFRCRLIERDLELTMLWKQVPEYSPRHYFGGVLPKLASIGGRLILTDTNGVFALQADGRWKRIRNR